MVQTKTEDSRKLGNKGNLEQKPIYHTKKFKEKLRNSYSESGNYDSTARELNEEFQTNISGTHVKNLLIKQGAKAISYSSDADHEFETTFNKINERWENSMKMIDWLHARFEQFKGMIEEGDNIQQLKAFITLTPQIIQIVEATRKQLEAIKKQQVEIKEAQKTLIFSPTQINNYLAEHESKLKKETFKNNPKFKDIDYIDEL